MSDDAELLALLRAIRDGDAADDPMDNDMLSTRLGWTANDVALHLTSARDRMLIWGSRSGGTPAPRFTDLELTVQGRRFMAAVEESGDHA
jgi:hypothetical protein